MATSGKKSKPKWTALPMESLTNTKKVVQSTTKSRWADEVDQEIDSVPSYKTESVVLPTAPRASRPSAVDESKIPHSPPYQAYLTNIPFDLTDDELSSHFKDLNIKSVNLPREDRTGGNRTRGFAYIVFEDRESLIAALNKADTSIKNRSINIDLATNDGGRGGMNRGRGNRDGRSDMGGPDRTAGDWRAGPRPDNSFQERSSNFDRGFGGFGGGSGRREFSSNSGFRSNNFDREDRGGGGFHREDRGFENRDRFGGGGRDDRDRRDGGYNNFDRERNFGRDDRGDRGSYGGDRNFSRNRDDRDDRFNNREDRGSNNHWRDESKSFSRREDERPRDSRFGGSRRMPDDIPVDKGPSSGPPKQRPTLKLLPKSTTSAAEGTEPTASMASIFGGAKPVDTAAREREIEDRLNRMNSEDTNGRTRTTSTTSGTSSVAAPPAPTPTSSGPSSIKDADEGKKRVEPAPPPKENPWSAKKPAAPTSEHVNNGRTTPEETHEDRGDSNKAWGRNQRQEPKRNEESRWGKGQPNRQPPNNNSEKSKGGKEEKTAPKHRESKKDNVDDFSKMPRVQESTVPNFAVSNKFSTLDDSDEAPTE